MVGIHAALDLAPDFAQLGINGPAVENRVELFSTNWHELSALDLVPVLREQLGFLAGVWASLSGDGAGGVGASH